MSNPAAFIPAWLDDLGLSANEFRIYAHICRRAGNGCCNAGIESISKACRMNEKTAKSAIEKLKSDGLISVEMRIGFSNIIRVSSFESTDYCSFTQSNPIPPPNEYPPQTRPPLPPQTRPPLPPQTRPPEGNTIKVTSTRKKKYSKNDLTLGIEVASEIPLPFQSEEFSEAWESWMSHRKQQKKKVTDESKKMVFRKFKAWGEERSIQSIYQSIEYGWTGIFEPRQATTQKQSSEPTKAKYL